MVDIRFHKAGEPRALQALLAALPRPHAVDDARAMALAISGADELPTAGAGHISLAAHKSYRAELQATAAGAVIVSPDLRDAVPPGSIAVVHERAHELFADILDTLYPASTRRGIGGLVVGEQVLVLGVAPGSVTRLHDMKRSELPLPADTAGIAAPAGKAFAAWLKQATERRNAG